MKEDNQSHNQQAMPSARSWREVHLQAVPRKMSEYISPEEIRRLLKEQAGGEVNRQNELPRSNS